ncbi:hypothetical protein IHE44_0003685, partial [Lamprotornis superbus]
MKDPSRSSTSPSIISEDVIINGHSHEDDNPFAEYMWMENEEEFNRQASHPLLSIEEELWEEEFIERCFQEMLEEEEEHEWFIPARDLPQTMDQIQDQFNDLVISDSSSLEDLVNPEHRPHTILSHNCSEIQIQTFFQAEAAAGSSFSPSEDQKSLILHFFVIKSSFG